MLTALAVRKGQAGIASKKNHVDVVALGNLCVDIVVPMDVLPPKDFEYRRRWVPGGLADDMSRLGLEASILTMIVAVRQPSQITSAAYIL